MTRNALLGMAVFGLASAAAGYVWVSTEFPFIILLPAVLGWFVVVRPEYGDRTAILAALVGGFTFTVVFILALFLALADGSPVSLPAWLGALLAAAVAGGLGGVLLDRGRGATAMAGFSAVGMLAALAISLLARSVAPGSVDVEGATQSAYFASTLGLMGAVLGAAIGAGASWIARRREHDAGSPAA